MLDLDTHDIIISRGTVRVGGVEYVAQLTKTRLLHHLAEWDLDESLGIDWYNIMGRDYDLSIIQGIVTQTITETEGVDSLTNIKLDLDRTTRKLSINFSGIALGEIFTETVNI